MNRRLARCSNDEGPVRGFRHLANDEVLDRSLSALSWTHHCELPFLLLFDLVEGFLGTSRDLICHLPYWGR